MRFLNVLRQLRRIDKAEQLRLRMIELSNKRDELRNEILSCKRELEALGAPPASPGLTVEPRGFVVER